MTKIIITLALTLATVVAFGQNQNANTVEEKQEMKDTVIVDGKLVEVGYRVIADGVTDGFTKIENGVVKGYKAIENGTVSGFGSVNDWFISKLFQRKGETLEETKARLPPKSAIMDNYSVVNFDEVPHGGHFTALEQPEAFADSIKAFYRALDL